MQELRIPAITAVIMLLFLFILSALNVSGVDREHFLRVSFLDVGQGDATFIESPTGTQVLIDGGAGNSILSQLHAVMGFSDRSIDMIIATHPDMDHIGGLIEVLDRYDVDTILMTENINDTPAFKTFQEKVTHEGTQIRYARRGQIFDLGDGVHGSTTLRILFPDRNPAGFESNMSSIVAQLVYGESEYLFTGDSPQEIEEYLVSIDNQLLQSDVLKIGHHGSRTSTSEMFVRAVNPLYAIISAGRDNSYGHPHKEVIDVLTRENIFQKSTMDEGTVYSESDGTYIWFR